MLQVWAAVLGIVGGFGLFMIIVGVKRKFDPPVIGKQGTAAYTGTTFKDVALRVKLATQQKLDTKAELRQDLNMIGRTVEEHTAIKITSTVVVSILMATAGGIVAVVAKSSLEGLPAILSPTALLIIAGAALGALLGWILPDSTAATDAEKERFYFQQVAESWLELVAQLVTAGEDTFSALMTATSYSEQPVFTSIRDVMREAALSGHPPWDGLRNLSKERRLDFLIPFCAALDLAGTTGTGAHQAILSQVESTRSKAMHEAAAEAAAAGEKMGAPLALISGAFMMIMGYPPMAGILESTTTLPGSL